MENGFVDSSHFDEILKQVQNDDLKAQRLKVSAFSSSYCAELEALCNEVKAEWNNAGDVEIN